ncbi:MAG: hypothetical protein A4E38_01685 [Methanoregulaceae archaeon PtaB.Bin108]|nr:MAG: hypothetical protein A4E38_01685 [Methanoregulaceae archaeon PtaB.Bin108]
MDCTGDSPDIGIQKRGIGRLPRMAGDYSMIFIRAPVLEEFFDLFLLCFKKGSAPVVEDLESVVFLGIV